MLSLVDTVLVIIDVQERLVPAMHGRAELIDALGRLIRGARVLELPIVLTEQNPRGLGPTIPELAELLAGVEPLEKLSFSCCGCPAFLQKIEVLGRRQVLLAGIEAHVCVYQTAMDLLARGNQVEIVADAVSSRAASNVAIALRKAEAAGAGITSTEMALFELLGVAQGERFKEILRIVK